MHSKWTICPICSRCYSPWWSSFQFEAEPRLNLPPASYPALGNTALAVKTREFSRKYFLADATALHLAHRIMKWQHQDCPERSAHTWEVQSSRRVVNNAAAFSCGNRKLIRRPVM